MDPEQSSSAFIRFQCVSPAHAAIGTAVLDGHGGLTVHQGAWAYCAGSRMGEEHEWQEIDPIPLVAVRHARKGRPVADPRPTTRSAS